ncbi:hypothetical protein ANN_00085 [Periplaneta americana]|uniref:Fatty acid synthase pseudo-KR domain-containing protein n=1 Tax=Periplaneta americana TaxID=6978 RepID=A0ABQ8TTT1_PERAM|nr:hypothetical protein ANN_00085 [Periplaneta americana]
MLNQLKELNCCKILYVKVLSFTGVQNSIPSPALTMWLLSQRRVVSDRAVISISSDDYSWLPQLQTTLSSSSDSQIVLVSQGDPLSGILGLVNCVSKEPGCDHVRY